MTLPNSGRAIRGLILSAAALALASPVFAGAGEEQAASAQAKAAEDEPKKICKLETKTGSNMPRRVCRTLTAKDLEAMEHEQEMRRANDAQRTSMGGPL